MKLPAIAAGASVTSLLAIAAAVGGIGSAEAAPGDVSTLPVDPNIVTDSMAYSAAPPVLNPNGQIGITQVYTHRDGVHQITNTILLLPDPAAATAALNGSNQSNTVANGKTQPAPVGTGGTIVSGTSPDGSNSVTLLTFTEGNAATTVEFDGPAKDPAPADVVTEYGQRQVGAINGQPVTCGIQCNAG